METSWGSGCDWWAFSEDWRGGGAGTVLVLELVGGYEGVPHTVHIKLDSYGFNFIFREDRQCMSWCISTTVASASLAGVLQAAKTSPPWRVGRQHSLDSPGSHFPSPGPFYTPERWRSERPTAALTGQPPHTPVNWRLPLLPAVPLTLPGRPWH